jgi:hypothetical protein
MDQYQACNLSSFCEDPNKQKEGVWIHFGNEVSGRMSFRVRRDKTPDYYEAEARISRGLFQPGERMTPAKRQLLDAHLMDGYFITDWDGDVCLNGEDPMPFNNANKSKLFLDERYWASLNVALKYSAGLVENYLYDEMVEDIETGKKP